MPGMPVSGTLFSGLRKPQFAALGGEIFRQMFVDMLVVATY
jgi:hypothetical protein